MKINYDVLTLDYYKRIRNLDVEAQGKVKSQKFFPVFLKDEKEFIFKPLSKTKPLTTPFFAYSEVIWSYLIHNYFDESAPVYQLGICDHYSDEILKYYNYGTVVPNVLDKNQK